MSVDPSVPWAVRRILAPAAVLAALLGGPSVARAGDQVCQRVTDRTMSADGLLDDWRGFRGSRAGSGTDHSMLLRCAYDSTTLYVSLDVCDDRVIRVGRPDPRRSDSVAVRLRAAGARPLSLRVFPGTRGFKPRVTGKPRWATVADSLQPRGFSVELALPLRRIRGWTPTLPALSADLRFTDVDGGGQGRAGARFRGRLAFSGADAVFKSFLQATGLSRHKLRLDTMADVDLGRGAERVVAGGNVIGVISDSFAYMTLPVSSPADVLGVKVVNFSGTGRSQIVAHYRQRGNGSRELVSVWNLGDGDRFERLLTVEVRKQLGTNVIEDRWSLVPAGKRRKKRRHLRGVDLVVEPAQAVGFDESNYHEMPPTDAKPIELPWGESGGTLYWFNGDSLGGSEALPKKTEHRRRR